LPVPELEELYQEILMDHANRPRCREELRDDEVDGEAHNRLCGDSVRMALTMAGDKVESVRFDGEGCAICMATASIAASHAAAKSATEVTRLCDQLVAAVREEEALDSSAPRELAAVAGVSRFPMRTKCAMLPWQALHDAVTAHATGNDECPGV
jgi:nitrogen fixation NifU-like protein